MDNRIPLLGKSLDELKDVAVQLGLKPFVGAQLADWIYKKRSRNFETMANISKTARAKLEAAYTIGCSAPVEVQRSVDGTAKYLYATLQGDYIETVYIPDGSRATLCVSSQVGCKMGCTFCMTGRQGYVASLSACDILNQIFSLPECETLTNIVFMGQGEPFDNLDNVLRALNVLTADWGWAWSPKRVTVSTVGLSKGLTRFLDECQCHLAISLHHPIPAERARLMPAERAFGIEPMINLLKQYDCFRKKKDVSPLADVSRQRRLSFEYIVFEGVNDSRAHADALLNLLRDLDCRVNLIRFHDIPDTPLKGVSAEKMIALRDYLTGHGLFTTVRASRGQDIFAACGLLTTAKQEEERAQQRKVN